MSTATSVIAYFSMEIGLEPTIPTYSGGLGVLAGDTIRAAADVFLPMLAITLVHRKGYFEQRLDESGWQHERPSTWDPAARLAAVQQRVTVEVDDPLALVHGYHDALARALGNVLLNAVEACRDGGAVTVRVRNARVLERPGVEMVVQDTGSGIAPEQLARMWDPYVTTKATGTGLGLPIARRNIELRGG